MEKEIKIKGISNYSRKLVDEVINNNDNIELLRIIKYMVDSFLTSIEQLEQNGNIELWEEIKDLSLGYDSETKKECFFEHSELIDLVGVLDTINDILKNNKVYYENK